MPKATQKMNMGGCLRLKFCVCEDTRLLNFKIEYLRKNEQVCALSL